jgi:putative transposase
MLEEKAREWHCVVTIYTFMPDHLHMVVTGTEKKSRPKQVVDQFKGLSGQYFARHAPHIVWQKGYYDHILRNGPDWKAQIFYIFNNPVRRFLANEGFEYPHTGSIGVDLQTIIAEAGQFES